MLSSTKSLQGLCSAIVFLSLVSLPFWIFAAGQGASNDRELARTGAIAAAILMSGALIGRCVLAASRESVLAVQPRAGDE